MSVSDLTVCWVCRCAQSSPTLWDPMDYSLPDSSVLEFSRQEPWSEFPFPTPGDLPDPGVGPISLMSPALAGGFFTTESLLKPQQCVTFDSFPYLEIKASNVFSQSLVRVKHMWDPTTQKCHFDKYPPRAFIFPKHGLVNTIKKIRSCNTYYFVNR